MFPKLLFPLLLLLSSAANVLCYREYYPHHLDPTVETYSPEWCPHDSWSADCPEDMEGEVVYPFYGCCCTSNGWISSFRFRCTGGKWKMDEEDYRYRCPNDCYIYYT